jgi:cation-transporting P-type ATPase I
VSSATHLVSAPVRTLAASSVSVVDVVSEMVGVGTRRRSWRGVDRCWIEVRGLEDAEIGPAVAGAVLAAVRAHPGVLSAEMNVALGRVVVRLQPDGPTTGDLGDLIDEAKAWRHNLVRLAIAPTCRGMVWCWLLR